ncbi:MAG: shikimate kinase [Deltaproteobacteria bacterium]|nr:shikimate kinase [Deltaproteobacteria bacterium]
MRIILIGYRCTGKSSIGKRLAQKLELPFYDTDTLIEAVDGMTIIEMVDQKGWEYFRSKEKECIRQVAMMKDCVIAPGGGAVMDADNAAQFNDDSTVIWLKADVDTILHRLDADQATNNQRPPLSDADIRQETEKILAERTPVYCQLADITIDTVIFSVEEAVEEIYRCIDRHSS